ncbi:MAG: flagellar biosynthetic protein FliQ [Alphaproteobacteria bacterium]|nr:MAG: flagellar biosynthetic protein FliQ [Alphaproteobacteria bacterium]
MSTPEILDIMRAGLWAAFVMTLPMLAAALIVGLVIGLIQALTSVQELTLTFVPKLGALLIVFWIAMGFMAATLTGFFHDRILPAIEGV